MTHRGAMMERMEQIRHRVVEGLTLRAAAEEGTFQGIACRADVKDAYGTTFAAGCWTAGGLDTAEGAYALLHMHNPEVPVGTLAAREDENGLFIVGAWDDTRDGRDARVRAKSGSAPGLSVGFVPLMVDPDDPTRFTQCRLVEVSQITARMAAVPGAQFTLARRTDAARIARARLTMTTVRR